MSKPTLLEMLQAGLHFGHQSSKWHPKMKQFIFSQRNGVHIIDLEKTSQKLEEALVYAKNVVSNGGVILFVATKKQAVPIIEKYAKDCGMPYITRRWLGGTLTNFAVILKLTKKYKDLKAKLEGPAAGLRGYTKREQLEMKEEVEKLQERVGGIAELRKMPDAIYVVDIKKEKTAVTEANRKKVPLIALCDSNVNPQKISYPIPANDDATKGIELITALLAEAIKEGQAAQKTLVSKQPLVKKS